VGVFRLKEGRERPSERGHSGKAAGVESLPEEGANLTTPWSGLNSESTVPRLERSKKSRWPSSGASRELLRIFVAFLFAFALASPASARSGAEDATSGLPAAPEEFSSIEAHGVRLRYHPDQSALARKLMLEAEPFRREVVGLLGMQPGDAGAPLSELIEVRLGRTPLEMEKLGPVGMRSPKYASGLALPRARLILLTASPRYPGEKHDLVQIFRHELAHIALADRVGIGNVPRWFDEGFAVFSSGEGEAARMQTLWTATLARRLIPWDELTRSFPEDAQTASVAYAQAADIIRYLLRGDGQHRFFSIFSRMNNGQTFESAVKDAYGEDLGLLEVDYRADAARRYTFWPILFASSTIWGVAAALFIVAYLRKRKQAQKKLARWAREEQLEDELRARLDAVRAPAIRIVLSEPEPTGEEVQPSGRSFTRGTNLAGIPFVEHDGCRHTLH
jgi:hypothetical protein